MPNPETRNPASGRLQDDLLAHDRQRRTARADLAKVAANEPARRNDLLPRLRLVDRPLDQLFAPKRNVRAITAAHVREVANSIAAFGFCKPVMIDESGNIIDGVASVEAAKLLGLQHVPCVVAEHLNAAERRLLRLAANRLGEKGEWNFEELKVEIEELVVLDVPIEISGFEVAEIDGILSDESSAVVEQGPLAPVPGAQAVARVGDTFLLGPHRITCGDARDAAVLATLMQDQTARMIFTDQPYNVAIAGHVTGGAHREFAMASGEMTNAEFDRFNAAWIGAVLAHVVDGGILATFIDWRGLGSVTTAALQAGLSQINLVVWGKTNAGMGSLYRSQHELLPMFKTGTSPHINNVALGRKGRHRSNLWTYAGASSLGSDARRGLEHHPTVKPVAMLSDALRDLTNRGDVVLDPFLGSGSTLIAAEKTGRVCNGIELDPLYVDVIVRRYEQATGEPAVLESSGETFAQLEERRRSEPGQAAQPALSRPSTRLRPARQT